MTAGADVQSVVDQVPPRMGLRESIALEVRSHIAERLEQGQPLDEVLRQFGDPRLQRPASSDEHYNGRA